MRGNTDEKSSGDGFHAGVFPWLALSVACSSAPDHGTMDDTRPADSTAGDGLAGTSWRLVGILMMDDQVYTPDERSKYTITLQRTDGSSCGRIAIAVRVAGPSRRQVN